MYVHYSFWQTAEAQRMMQVTETQFNTDEEGSSRAHAAGMENQWFKASAKEMGHLGLRAQNWKLRPLGLTHFPILLFSLSPFLLLFLASFCRHVHLIAENMASKAYIHILSSGSKERSLFLLAFKHQSIRCSLTGPVWVMSWVYPLTRL